MNKFQKVLMAAVVVLGSAAPAFAADGKDSGDQFITDVSTMPARVLGVALGVGVGVPIATAQATCDATDAMYKRVSNALPDTDSPANKAYSAVVAVPVGLTGGLLNGVIYGVKHAALGFEQPFSAQSMSIDPTKAIDEY